MEKSEGVGKYNLWQYCTFAIILHVLHQFHQFFCNTLVIFISYSANFFCGRWLLQGSYSSGFCYGWVYTMFLIFVWKLVPKGIWQHFCQSFLTFSHLPLTDSEYLTPGQRVGEGPVSPVETVYWWCVWLLSIKCIDILYGFYLYVTLWSSNWNIRNSYQW
jgi:hypothetical protein